MQSTPLGSSTLEVSTLGLGTGVLRSDRDVWEPGDENELIAAVHVGMDCGVNFFDTAPTHGHGLAEELLGKALQDRRDEVVVATKCGLRRKDHGEEGFRRCLTPASLTSECEASLRRLRRESVDLLQCHWPDPETPIEETVEALERLVEQGKIRAYGLANFGMQRLVAAASAGRICSLQVPLSLFRREAGEDLVPFCHQSRISVLASDPWHGGRLDEPRSSDGHVSTKPDDADAGIISTLRAWVSRRGASFSLRQLGVAWTCAQPGVTVTLVHARRPSQVRDAVTGVHRGLTQAELAEVQALLTETT